ncbi:hypothetical protein GWK47_030287 [Chionoecetes opilio]|uniref:Uncharacterized protein n=1 Tax=Chionoecetes opilio TaxID=41210 RepID=A0A8J4YLP3_CHIOP|nr:hypothetical protein GWK47_030287 [Chionoecetes opilio]
MPLAPLRTPASRSMKDSYRMLHLPPFHLVRLSQPQVRLIIEIMELNCTIADREHRKWEAAVPLPNNPYSPERLAHRLSHSRPPDHPRYTRHAPPVEFSGDSTNDLDPSLQEGMPPRADLNRYSRDYYVPSSTNRNAAKNRINLASHQNHTQDNSLTSKPHLTNGCHSLPSPSPQVTSNGQVCSPVLHMHAQAPCIATDLAECSKTPLSLPEASISLHSSPPVSHCSAVHAFGNTSSTTVTYKGLEISSGSPGKVDSSIIDRFDRGKVTPPSPSLTHRPNRSAWESKRPSSFTLSTARDSHSSSDGKVKPSGSQSSLSSCQSSPLSSLVSPLLPESPGIGRLEGDLIHRSVTRLSFRARQATKEFSLNPLYEDEVRPMGDDTVETHHPSQRAIPDTPITTHPSEPSSDYYSSYESLPYLSSFSREGSLRLPKPQVTEEVFESLSDMGGSVRLKKNKSPLKPWGSFKHKRDMMF